MAREINQRELRNDSGSILQAAADGETFIVTRNGTPMAELRPLTRRRFVSKNEVVRAMEHMLPIDAEEFRRDVDSFVDQDPFYDRG